MDTRSKRDNENELENQNKGEETTKQPLGEADDELTPPPKGSIRYKLRAKWIRVIMFILSGLLAAYGITALEILSSMRYRWDIEAALMGEEQPAITNNIISVTAGDVEVLYKNLCIAASNVMRYDEMMSFEYVNEISNCMVDYGNGWAFFDEGDRSTLYADSKCFDYYVAYGDRYFTSVDSLGANAGYDELAYVFGKMDEQYYIRVKNKVYTGGKESELLSSVPLLPLGAAFYDAEDKAHSFCYDSTNDFITVFENNEEIMEKYTVLMADDDGDEYSDYFLPWYRGGNLKYIYDKEKDDYKFSKSIQKLDDSAITVAIGVNHDMEAVAAAEGIDRDEQLKLSKALIISLIPVSIIFLIIVLLLMIRCGYDRDTGGFTPTKWFDKRVWTEAFLAAAIASLVGAGGVFNELGSSFDTALPRESIPFYAAFAGVIFLLWIVGFGSSLVLLRKLKTKKLFSSLIIVSFIRLCWGGLKRAYAAANEKLKHSPYDKLSVSRKMLIRNIIFAVLTGIAVLLPIIVGFGGGSMFNDDMLPVFIYFTAYGVYFVWYNLSSLSFYDDAARLCDKLDTIGTNEVYDGEDVPYESPFYASYKSLDSLDERIKTAAEEMVKSEKTKVELVTNVSHDLKTPLTSIISYTYLLSKEEMSDEAKDYVRILQAKSEKLKAIVNDVFTLAKAASGAEVKHERLDLTMLVNQTVAGNQDIIDESGLTVRVSVPEAPVYIMGDGDKLSRVLQNLLDNALKYSLKGTRVFIEMTAAQHGTSVSCKNTSAEEMNFTADEITERFTRGDKSRTDGGSGLGLSIAKTFTEACGGQFRVELEGDMFKAIASFDTIE